MRVAVNDSSNEVTIVIGNTFEYHERSTKRRLTNNKRSEPTRSLAKWSVYLDVIDGNRDLISQVQFQSPFNNDNLFTSQCYARRRGPDGKRINVWRFQSPAITMSPPSNSHGPNDGTEILVKYTGAGGTVRSVLHALALKDGGARSSPVIFAEPRSLHPIKPVKLPNLDFGIELELSCSRGTSRDDIASLLAKHTGVQVYSNAPRRPTNSDLSDGWKLVGDGSILCSAHAPDCSRFELVSRVLRGGAGLNECNNMLKALSLLDSIVVNKSMGFHVHVSIKGLSAHQLAKVCQNFVKYEDVIDTFMPPSRRSGSEESNRYFKSNKLAVMGRKEGSNAKRHKLIGSCKNKVQLCDLLNPKDDRYYKINLMNVKSGRQPTLEFRQHSATSEYGKVAAWVRFCVALVHNSAHDPKTEHWTGPANDEKFNELFERLIRDRALRDFFAKRRAALQTGSEKIEPCCSSCGHGMTCETADRSSTYT